MADDRALAERLLGHPVDAVVDLGPVVAAASVAGDPPQSRVAFIDPARAEVLARVACPPAVPSPGRPVVATAVTLDEPLAVERVLVARAAPGIAGVRPVVATDEPVPDVPVGAGGLAPVRVPVLQAIDGVEALDAKGRRVGRLAAPGIGLLAVTAGQVSGRPGIGHGMAAGFGPGVWVGDEEVALVAGQEPLLPAWLPEGLERGRFRLEPDPAYPDGPPAVAVAWGQEPERVLLRQAPAPLAAPDTGAGAGRVVDVAGVPGVLRGRRMATLVWERDGRAFGLQVRGVPDPPAAALRIAASL
ncbi:MAG TPA: hypothetical protein VKD47_01940 [Miltoncostaeaceae bacterium]|nr:hypothetical protein [Miltoncostaeaceae bacterium]